MAIKVDKLLNKIRESDAGIDGNGIQSITTEKVGKTTTVTITETDSTVTNFDIEDGIDGIGSGDFMADGSVPMTGDLLFENKLSGGYTIKPKKQTNSQAEANSLIIESGEPYDTEYPSGGGDLTIKTGDCAEGKTMRLKANGKFAMGAMRLETVGERTNETASIDLNSSGIQLVGYDISFKAYPSSSPFRFPFAGVDGGTIAVTSDIPAKANSTEVTTGTDDTKFITADSFSGSNYGKRIVQMVLTDDATGITAGDGKGKVFIVPAEMNGWNLVAAHAAVTTVSSSGTPTYQVRNITDSVDMLSTRITIDANEFTSYTAATAPVIDTTKDDVATGDRITIDKDVAGTGEKGDVVILVFQNP